MLCVLQGTQWPGLTGLAHHPGCSKVPTLHSRARSPNYSVQERPLLILFAFESPSESRPDPPGAESYLPRPGL